VNQPNTQRNHQSGQDASTLLGGIPLFSDLTTDEILTIESHAHIKSYRKHTVIIEKGDDTTSLYVLVSGKVKVFLANEDGKELLLHALGPGSYFGELALLGGGARTASVMTEEDSRLLVISKHEFVDCLRSHPEIALELIRHLVSKLADLTERTGTLALRDVYGRVVATLQEQAVEEDGRLITARLTHQALAEIVGSSREMISRIFKDLKQGGYIDVENKRVILKKKLPPRW
jgi:CRP/FNR family cyclic AMP-dependent transcriptional regulator